MDKSICRAGLLGLALVSGPVLATAVDAAFGETGDPSGAFEYLSDSELSETRGELAPTAVLLYLGFMGAIAEGGVSAAIEQYNETGEVKAGPVVLSALENAALYALNTGALWTRSVILVTTAMGIDLAYFSARAFARDPTAATGSGETLVQTYFSDHYDPELVGLHASNYEVGQSLPLDMDLMPLAGYLEALPGSGGAGYLPADFGYNGVSPVTGIPGLDTVGAGESQYRYF